MRQELILKTFPVLDQGSVTLLDVMGDDAAIADAARISFGKGTRSVSDDRTLLRYLFRHFHSTPFEMAEIKLHIKIPMDSWRQMIRHRTANVNEYSTRYSEAIDDKQVTYPDLWRRQAITNKQGSSGDYVDEWPDGYSDAQLVYDSPGAYLSHREDDFHDQAAKLYQERLTFGVAREQARKDLPLSTYTSAIWKCDIRNVFHFLGLRMDSHAQLEIRSYANVIGHEIVAKLFPLSWEAFRDYQLNALTLSAPELNVIREISASGVGSGTVNSMITSHITNGRERDECRSKLVRLGLISE